MGMDAVLDHKAEPLHCMDTIQKKPQVLVVSCSRDFAYSTSSEEAWKEVIPGSSLVETQLVNFKECRHYPFYEEEAAYGKTLREFLSQVEQ